MKTNYNTNNISNTNKATYLVVAFCIITIPLFYATKCSAQGCWDSSQTKTKSIIYDCKKDFGKVYIKNSKFEEPTKRRKQYDNERLEYSFIKLLSHEKFIAAFKESFSKEKRNQLIKDDEKISVFIDTDENGSIINIGFSINVNSKITPTEIENLENLLTKQIKFSIIGKKVNEPIFYHVFIRVSFSEVEKGEILMARAMENAKVPN